MKSKRSWFKRFKGWLLSFIIIDLITLFTRLVESLFKKDKNLITIFFTEFNFADNSRYFLEYLNLNTNHNYNVKVLVKNKPLFDEISLQYPDITYYSKSLSGFNLFFKTKNMVISHGSDASYFFPYFLDVKSKNIINLWHGIPLKRLSLQVKGIRESKSRNRFQKFSSICAASTFEQILLASCFDMHIDDVWVTGTPRNDYLIYPNNDLVQKYTHLNEKVILYAPTHRDAIHGGETGFLPILHPDFSEEEIHNFLEKMKSRLIIRPHPISSTGKCTSDRIEYITVDQVPDIAELFRTSDILVTDYSSTYFDWLILDKPIIFSIYDFQEYGEEIGFIEEFEDIAAGQIALTKGELLESLEKSIKKSDYDVDKRMKVREMIGMARGDSCRRISKSIISRIELK